MMILMMMTKHDDDDKGRNFQREKNFSQFLEIATIFSIYFEAKKEIKYFFLSIYWKFFYLMEIE